MTYVDAALLDLTEWLCHRFQAWTGKTNVWLAFHLTSLSVVIYFTSVGTLYFVTGIRAVRIVVAVIGAGALLTLTRTFFRQSIQGADAQAYRRLTKGLRNPRRVRDAQLRIAFFTLSLILIVPMSLAYTVFRTQFQFVTEALAVLTTAVLYLLACDPLPPCAGKLWQVVKVSKYRERLSLQDAGEQAADIRAALLRDERGQDRDGLGDQFRL